MESILGLYQKLWKSLIRPRRLPYSSYDLGDNFMAFESTCAIRMDFKLENPLGETFHLSLFLPCNEKEEIPKDLSYVVYCHTHNGNRTEGLYLVEKVLSAGYGFVVFDFRANGYSSGQFVTLGWLEVLDINTVVLFLKTEVKAKFICLWGRSMGGSASLFYSSELFRQRIDAAVTRMNKQKVTWASRAWVDCIVVDSCFPNLVDTIQCLVKNKTNGKVPEWLVSLVLSVINREVKSKAFIDIGEINPSSFVKDIRAPIYMAIGNEDELVSTDRFVEMFSSVDSKLKKIRIFKGQHADERPESLLDPIVEFIKEMFRLKSSYLENRANMTKITDVTMNVPLSDLSKLNVNALKNQQRIRSKTPDRPPNDFQRKNTDGNRTKLKIYDDSAEKKGEHVLKNNMPSFLGHNAKLIKPTNTADLNMNKANRIQPIQATNKSQNPKPQVITNEDYFADFEPEVQFRKTNDGQRQEMINKEGFNLRLSHKPIQFDVLDFKGNHPQQNTQKDPDDPSILMNPERISQVMRENNIPEQKLKEVAGGAFFNDLSIRVKSSINFNKKRSHLGNLHQQKIETTNKQPPGTPIRYPEIQEMNANANNFQKSEIIPNHFNHQISPKPVVVTMANNRPVSPAPNKPVYVEAPYPPLITQAQTQKPNFQTILVSEIVRRSPQPNQQRFANPVIMPPPQFQPQPLIETPVRFLSNQNHLPQQNPGLQHPSPIVTVANQTSNPKTPYVPQMVKVENNIRRKDYLGREKGRNSFRGSENEEKELFDFGDFNDFKESRMGNTPQLKTEANEKVNERKLTTPNFFEPKPAQSRTKMVESIQLGALDISEGKSVDLELSPSPSPMKNVRK